MVTGAVDWTEWIQFEAGAAPPAIAADERGRSVLAGAPVQV